MFKEDEVYYLKRIVALQDKAEELNDLCVNLRQQLADITIKLGNELKSSEWWRKSYFEMIGVMVDMGSFKNIKEIAEYMGKRMLEEGVNFYDLGKAYKHTDGTEGTEESEE